MQVLEAKAAAHAHVEAVLIVEALVDLHRVLIDRGVLHRGDAGRAHGGERVRELFGLVLQISPWKDIDQDVGGVVA